LRVFVAIIIIITTGIIRSTVAASNFSQCFDAIRNGTYGPSGGVDIHGQPIQNIAQAVGMTYELCKRACGTSPESFDWHEFAEKFTSWLLPWLALISQLPFGAKYRVDNLTSMVLAVGSPTLAAYSLILTILNGQWVARRFSGVSYPNSHHAFRIMNSLQQAPLQIANESSLLSSLVVLPENDEWWSDLVERLDYTHTWSISASAAIMWVFTAYIFTVVDSFASLKDEPSADRSDGQAVGSAWLWLLPVVIAWLQISPKCDSDRLENAILRTNAIAYIAVPNSSVASLASAESEARAFTFRNGESTIYDDAECSAPIFNYARFLSWTQNVEAVVSAFHSASHRAKQHKPVDERSWQDGDKDHPIHPNNRRGSEEQVENYCTPPTEVTRSHWGPNVLSRFMLASFVALSLQWGTTGAAIIILWYTPTVGLGCRSASYLVYAAASTVVWMLLVISSILTHYVSPRHSYPDQHGSPDHHFRFMDSIAKVLAIMLRRLGKLLAACNAAWIVLACLLQFSNFYSRCYCNSCVTSLGRRAYAVVMTSASDVWTPWVGGVSLGCACAVLFVGFVNVFINPNP